MAPFPGVLAAVVVLVMMLAAALHAVLATTCGQTTSRACSWERRMILMPVAAPFGGRPAHAQRRGKPNCPPRRRRSRRNGPFLPLRRPPQAEDSVYWIVSLHLV